MIIFLNKAIKFFLKIGLTALFFILNSNAFSQSLQTVYSPNEILTFSAKQNIWVDSIMQQMTLEQKIGQLFMVSAFSNRNEVDYRKLEEQIQKYHLGGIIFFQGTPIRQAQLTNRYQSVSTIPLMIGIDGEWGLGMRLDDLPNFPKAITLGSISDLVLIEKTGFEIGSHCKRMGIHINFAPDADINSNPKNPVINYRSFGESPGKVANLASAFAKGMKRAGILASAKHFPGHGDTDVDSHRSLPILNHTKKHLDDIETLPFKKMIEDSVGSIMIGHLQVPSIDDSPNMAASISKKVIDGFLKKELGFKGLVITDALNMRGLLKNFPTGQAEVMAFEAGNDILLQTSNIDVAFNALKNKFLDSTLNIADLDEKVRKILQSKYWLGLNKYHEIDINGLLNDLSNYKTKDLKDEIFAKAATLVKDDEDFVPLKTINNLSYASVAIAAKKDNVFQQVLGQYGNVEAFNISYKPTKAADWQTMVDQAAQKDIVIVSVHDLNNSENRNYGVVPETIAMINELSQRTKVIVCVFGNPYALKLFDGFTSVICGYEEDKSAHIAVANLIFGVNPASGKIPVNTLSNDAKLNDGLKTFAKGRLGYAPASQVGMNTAKLEKIKAFAEQGIMNGEYPGCQILVARKGKVVFHESFGNLRYGVNEPVNNNTIYDLASLTKVTATLQAVMMLYDKQKLDIDQKASYYLPELEKTNKRDIIIKDLLFHQAGLKAFVPFWTNTKTQNGTFKPEYYADTTKQNLNVTQSLHIIPSIKDSVFKWIAETQLVNQPGSKKYLYSDLGLIILQRIVEKITNQNLDVFLDKNVYQAMAMGKTGYNIYKKAEINSISPTEIERSFRPQAIHGTVHDPNAALLGGVSGHAGLFSTAWDLAKLFQMNLNKGQYAENQFFSAKTLDYFTQAHSNISHRALGWNKATKGDPSVSEYASASTYGHTGFTGTAAWVDPENELIYIFLSNRVYPSADNEKLIKNKTRKRIHDLVYEAIEK
jgi:beta-N-acetylhexosaminidase